MKPLQSGKAPQAGTYWLGIMLWCLAVAWPCQAEGGFDGDAGPNHRVRREESSDRARTRGNVVGDKSRVVEVASGVNYWDGQQWSPSEAKFVQQGDGSFTAEKVHHRIRLKRNLNRQNSVTMALPDGTVLKSAPIGIRLYDTASGDSVVIGTIKDCVPSQLSDGQIIYNNAFSGVCAAVLYTIEKGSFQQDVVITSNLNPEDWGFLATFRGWDID